MTDEGEALVAIGSRSLEKAKGSAAEHGIPKAYGSYKELATDSEVEAVYSAAPNNLHYENAFVCLNAGKLELMDEIRHSWDMRFTFEK